MKRIFILLYLWIPIICLAQGTGKIMGVVSDKSTGEPLPGVNIILENTRMGASTDNDGYYVILNVPVSTFTLRANYIGYQDVRIEDVKVSVGITTEQNFQLEPAVLEMEEAIVVTAERTLVEKHVTQSISLVTAEFIENIPIRGLTNLLALQNSVVVQDGNIHIRGSRPEEVGFYVDGASTKNLFYQTNDMSVIQEAIEEFQVLAGGYTAEFGGANAGITRTELKTGTPDWHFSLDFQTDRFAIEGEKFINTYSYKHNITVATLSGPLFSKNIRFFLAGSNQYQGDFMVRFSEGFRFENLVDTNPEGSGDTLKVLTYSAGYTPNNSTDIYAFNGTLLFDYTPLQFRLSSSYNYGREYANSAPMLNILNNRNGYDDLESFIISGKMTHLINPSTFYDLNVNYFYSAREKKDAYFGSNWQKWNDSLAVAQHTGGHVIFKDRWTEPDPYIFNGFVFSQDGSRIGRYQIYKENYWGGSANLMSQITRNHEIRAGIEAQYYTLRRFRINSQVMRLTEVYGISDITQIPDSLKYSWSRYGSVNNYGYDIFGREVDNGFDEPKHPLLFAIYLQDKVEYGDIIINVGLRFDYFDSDDRRLKDPANPQINLETGLVEEDQWENIPPHQQLSPRLGFSFPVSDRTVFYTQYGKFIQMPQDAFIYPGNHFFARQLLFGGGIDHDLKPVRTTSYEIGFRQQLSRVAAFDLTGFYRNIKGQVQTDIQAVDPNSDAVDYTKYINGAFSTTKGIEFRLILRRIRRLKGQLNYTLTSAEGTGNWGWTNRSYNYRGVESRIITKPLDYSQTHRGSVNLDYRFGTNDGGIILKRTGLNLLVSFNSGHPYTQRDPLLGSFDAYSAGITMNTAATTNVEAQNSSKTPWNFALDMRLDKTINLWGQLQSNFYIRILNVLNTQNVINVYPVTGDAYDDGFLSNPEFSQATIEAYGGEQYVQMYRAINSTNGQAYWDMWDQQLYNHPRQIFLGIKIIY